MNNSDTKQAEQLNETALRVLITKASSEEEALGKAIINFNDEMANFNLSCKVVIRLNEE